MCFIQRHQKLSSHRYERHWSRLYQRKYENYKRESLEPWTSTVFSVPDGEEGRAGVEGPTTVRSFPVLFLPPTLLFLFLLPFRPVTVTTTFLERFKVSFRSISLFTLLTGKNMDYTLPPDSRFLQIDLYTT